MFWNRDLSIHEGKRSLKSAKMTEIVCKMNQNIKEYVPIKKYTDQPQH